MYAAHQQDDAEACESNLSLGNSVLLLVHVQCSLDRGEGCTQAEKQTYV